MRKYLVQRVLFTLFGIIGATLVAFMAMHLAPGDPLQLAAEERRLDPRVVENLRREYGLDEPLLVQYAIFLGKAVQGDLGTSYFYVGRPVTEILERDTLNIDQIKDWLVFLSADWDGAWQSEEGARAYFAGRNFLRAIRLALLEGDDVPNKEAILEILRETSDQARPWLDCI